jgi:hypothetical protein
MELKINICASIAFRTEYLPYKKKGSTMKKIIVSTIALACLQQLACAQEGTSTAAAAAAHETGPENVDKPGYNLMRDQAFLGSHIRRAAATGSIPFDKTYAELSEVQKNSLKAVYESMGPEDEPPYPIKGVKKIMKAFVTIGDKLQAEGKVHLLVDVDSKGNATSVSALKAPDPEIARYMANVLMVEKYKPAVCAGQPCAQQYNFEMMYIRPID